jgi:hypothetical protein
LGLFQHCPAAGKLQTLHYDFVFKTICMRKFLPGIISLLFYIQANSQQLAVQLLSDGAAIRSSADEDIITVQEGAADIKIRVQITDSKNAVIVTATDPLGNTATQGVDYTCNFGVPPVPLVFYNFNLAPASFMMESFTITIPADGVTESPEHFELHFTWPNALDAAKPHHRVLKVKIFDQSVKKSHIAGYEKPVTSKLHRDHSNSNKSEYIQFTDFTGFDNDRPNGRLQTELRFKWGIAKNWRGREGGWQYQFLRAVIFPDILFNRIDKSQKEEAYDYRTYIKGPPNQDSLAPKFATMDIWKYSNFQVGGRLVLLTLKKENFRLQLQGSIRLIRNRPFVDTTISQSGKTDSSIFRSTYSVSYSAELYGKTLLDAKKHINLDFTAGIMLLYLRDSYYEQYDAAAIDQFNRATVLLPVRYPSQRVRPIYNFSFRLSKNVGEDKDHFVYLRTNWMYQTGKYNPVYKRVDNAGQTVYQVSNEPRRFYNNFLQVQAGISLDIKTLFQKSEKKDGAGQISDSNN